MQLLSQMLFDESCELVCIAPDRVFLFSFEHDSQLGLGAGIPYQQAAAAVQYFIDFPYAKRKVGNLLQVPFFPNPHIDKDLRETAHPGCQKGKRRVLLLQDGEDLERGDQAVARCIVVEENDMARLLAAEIVSSFEHFFHDVPALPGPRFSCTPRTTLCSSSPSWRSARNFLIYD